MELLKINSVRKVNAIQTTGTSNLVNKADYSTKTTEIDKKILDHNHDKIIITTQMFNKLMTENFAATLAQAKLATKTDITNIAKKDRF